MATARDKNSVIKTFLAAGQPAQPAAAGESVSDRITIWRTSTRVDVTRCWHIEVAVPAAPRRLATKEHMDLTREELAALAERISEILS